MLFYGPVVMILLMLQRSRQAGNIKTYIESHFTQVSVDVVLKLPLGFLIA